MDSTQTVPRLHPDEWYRPRELARKIDSGPRPVYRAIHTGELKAAPINGRGDLRIRGAWAIAWLEANRDVPAGLSVVTYYPLPEPGFASIWDVILGSALNAVGLQPQGPILLDGLVSLWQGPSSL